MRRETLILHFKKHLWQNLCSYWYFRNDLSNSESRSMCRGLPIVFCRWQIPNSAPNANIEAPMMASRQIPLIPPPLVHHQQQQHHQHHYMNVAQKKHHHQHQLQPCNALMHKILEGEKLFDLRKKAIKHSNWKNSLSKTKHFWKRLQASVNEVQSWGKLSLERWQDIICCKSCQTLSC